MKLDKMRGLGPLAHLRERKQAIEKAEPNRPDVPTRAAIRHRRGDAEAMNRGTLQQQKALLQQLVVGVEVTSRSEIIPTFRVPATPVRVMDRVVVSGGLEPSTSRM